MVSAYILSASSNNKRYLTESVGTRDMWRKLIFKQHTSPPELGKGNAQGPVDTMHEPTVQLKDISLWRIKMHEN